MNTPREWEEEFEEIWKPLVKHNPVTLADKLVVDAWNGKRTQLKSFIRTIEDKAREEEREKANISDFSAGFTFGRSVEREMVRELVEGMKERTRHFPMKSNGGNWDEWNDGYDKALSDIITALNEKEV